MNKIIRIATRSSPLALWQANFIREGLLERHPNLKIELLPMTTSGDAFLKDRLSVTGGKGLFVKELEEAILANQADIAVHSTKDVPSELPEGLILAAICKRHNPYDAFVSNHFSSIQALPSQAIIGTSSLRRQSQLLASRKDLHVKVLRGNIHTRLSKLDAGEYQAIILAASGLERMGFTSRITMQIPEHIMLPACGQGALSIECRQSDTEMIHLLQSLHDPSSAICVEAERKVNALLGGNCHLPLAVFCTMTSPGRLLLKAKISDPDGTQVLFESVEGALQEGAKMAEICTKKLLAKGGNSILQSLTL